MKLGYQNVLKEIIDAGYLPKQFLQYRQNKVVTWDIETLESKSIPESNLNIQAALNVVSIR